MKRFITVALILIAGSALAFVSYKAMKVPGPTERDKPKVELGPKYQKGIFDLEAMKEETEELEAKIAQMPPFVVPQSTVLTEEMVKRYVAINTFVFDVIHKLKEKEPKKKASLGEGLYWANAMGHFVNNAFAKAQEKAGTTPDEYNWLELQLKRAALLVVNHELKKLEPRVAQFKEDEEETPEIKDLRAQLKKMQRIQEHLSIHLDLYDKTASPPRILPGMLDESKVPKENIRLFFKYKLQIDWSQGVNFKNLDIDESDYL